MKEFSRLTRIAIIAFIASLTVEAIALRFETMPAAACLLLGVAFVAAIDWVCQPNWKVLLMRAIESTPAGLCMFDAKGRVLISNAQFATMYDLTQTQVRPGMTLKEVSQIGLASFAPSRRLEYAGDFSHPDSAHRSVHRLSDGRTISVARHAMADGGSLEVHRDITDERLAEDRANEAMQALIEKQFAIDQAVIVAITDIKGTITYVNDNFCRISEYSRDELIGQNHRILNSGMHPRELFCDMYRSLVRGDVWRGELCNRSKSGRHYWVDTVITPQLGPDGKPHSYMAIRVDITAKREAQAQVSYAATHDSLTGLSNRSTLLEQARARLREDGRSEWFSIHLIDLDGFKNVNDTFGHGAGDELLRQVSVRLRSLTEEEDLVARLGGDEFVVIRRASGPAQEPSVHLSRRLVEAMAEPFELDTSRISISASIGIALYPERGSNPEDLIKKADLALYEVKAEGRNGLRVYQPAMLEAVKAERTLESKLRMAIARHEFTLHYQPIFDVQSRTTRGAEALVRWRHPEDGLIPPAQFIPVAEQTGLILPLSEWIIQQACQDAVTWPTSIRLAINVSALQFRRGNLSQLITRALLQSGLSPQRLQIEVTETALLEHQPEQLQTFRQLKNMGIAVVLDDFGTGYSSASYVTNFPFDEIKVDKSFVHGLPRRECVAVIASAVALAKGLDISITAEGVETEQQFRDLQSMGVDCVQGYLFSRPVPYDQFILAHGEQRSLHADLSPTCERGRPKGLDNVNLVSLASAARAY